MTADIGRKTLRTYEWFEFLIIFCAAVTVTTFLISVFLTYLGLPDLVTTVPSYLMSGENRLFKSGKTIRLLWDFCRSRISAGFGKVLDSGRSRNPVQPY